MTSEAWAALTPGKIVYDTKTETTFLVAATAGENGFTFAYYTDCMNFTTYSTAPKDLSTFHLIEVCAQIAMLALTL